MSNFNVGDKIRVKRDVNLSKKANGRDILYLLNKNKIYTIVGLEGGNPILDVKGDPSPEESWGATIFEALPKEHYVKQFIKKLW